MKSLFQQPMTQYLSLYLAGYILLISMLSWRIKNTPYLLALPLIVAAAAFPVWSGAGRPQLMNWVEIESGDSHARVSSILLLGGNRRGESRVILDADTRLSSLHPNSNNTRLLYPQGPLIAELQTFTPLLSPSGYLLASVSREALPFSLMLKQGHPQVVFLADEFPDKPRLLWQGRSYDIPKLSKGQTWQPVEALGHPPQTESERLLSRRLSFADPALLLPFNARSTAVLSDNLQSTGWMVIRHSSKTRAGQAL